MKINLKHVLIVVIVNMTLLLILLFGANLVAYKIIQNLKKESLGATNFEYQNKFIFYNKYANQLNHLRHLGFLNESLLNDKGENNYLYSKIGAGEPSILIQGDSWAERMLTSKSALNQIENLSSEKNTSILVGGISSFSPTPMLVQLRILRNDFNFHPSTIIAIIDQTDIGDELVRYRNLKQLDNNGNLILKRDAENEPFDLTLAFHKLNILYGSDFSLLKLWRLKKFENSRIELPEPQITWKKISAPLYGEISKEDASYFKTTVEDYIKYVFSDPLTKNLIIISNNHKLHEHGLYKINVGQILTAVIGQSSYKSKIKLYKFSLANYGDLRQDQIFLENDPASHLTPMAQGILMRNIINQLNN